MIVEFDNTPAVYVDCDGTLIFWPGEDAGCPPSKGDVHYGESPKVNRSLVDALKRWHKGGRCLVVWSRAGGGHAQRVAQMCGLSPDACLPKPRVAFDDRPQSIMISHGHGFVWLGPDEGNMLSD